MAGKQEFQLTRKQQADLEAIFGHVADDGQLNAAEFPQECLDALLTTLREKLSKPVDASVSLKWVIRFASGKMSSRTEERLRRTSKGTP